MPSALQAFEALHAFARRVLGDWPDGLRASHAHAHAAADRGRRPALAAGVSDDAVRFSAFLRLFNVTGQPAITVPVGETRLGVQLVGPPGRDDLVLAVAAQLEEALQ